MLVHQRQILVLFAFQGLLLTLTREWGVVHAFLVVHRRQSPSLARRVAVIDDDLWPREEQPNPIVQDYNVLLETCLTKKVPVDTVFNSMLRMEKQSYHDLHTQTNSTAMQMMQDLIGDWSPIFTSGTTTTQKRLGNRRMNYFPIKAVISFRPIMEDSGIGPLQNGLYFGDYHLVRLTGTYKYDPKWRKLRFGYDHMSLFNGAIKVHFKEGEDIQFALATGLGGKIGLWNILLADQSMMMARGAGRGLTLWKRRQGHKDAFGVNLRDKAS